jgi:hypothetical protein
VAQALAGFSVCSAGSPSLTITRSEGMQREQGVTPRLSLHKRKEALRRHERLARGESSPRENSTEAVRGSARQ